MGRVPFRVSAVPRRYQDRIAQAAVLGGLYYSPSDPGIVKLLTGQAWRLWQLALNRVSQAGVSLAGGPQALTAAKACRGGVCICRPQPNYCWWSVCPFCYARATAAEWQLVSTTISSLRQQSQPFSVVELHDHELLGFGSTEFLPRSVYSQVQQPPPQILPADFLELSPEQIEQRAKRLNVVLRAYVQRQTLQTHGKPLAMYATVTVEAWPQCWHIMSRRLLIVPDPWPRADWVQSRKRCVRRGTRRAAAYALASVCRYPKYMLRADPGLFGAQLLAFQGLRLSKNLGLFRRQEGHRHAV